MRRLLQEALKDPLNDRCEKRCSAPICALASACQSLRLPLPTGMPACRQPPPVGGPSWCRAGGSPLPWCACESEATAPPSHHPPPAGLCCSAMPLCRCTTRSPFISRCALRPVATLGGPACCTRGQHPCAWRQRWHAAFRPDPACWAALHGCRWCDRVAPSTASPSNLMNFQQVHFAPLLTAGHV